MVSTVEFCAYLRTNSCLDTGSLDNSGDDHHPGSPEAPLDDKSESIPPEQSGQGAESPHETGDSAESAENAVADETEGPQAPPVEHGVDETPPESTESTPADHPVSNHLVDSFCGMECPIEGMRKGRECFHQNRVIFWRAPGRMILRLLISL